MHTFEEVAVGLRFPEGPVALPDGSVLVAEVARGTVTRIDPRGVASVLATPGGSPGGCALGPDVPFMSATVAVPSGGSTPASSSLGAKATTIRAGASNAWTLQPERCASSIGTATATG